MPVLEHDPLAIAFPYLRHTQNSSCFSSFFFFPPTFPFPYLVKIVAQFVFLCNCPQSVRQRSVAAGGVMRWKKLVRDSLARSSNYAAPISNGTSDCHISVVSLFPPGVAYHIALWAQIRSCQQHMEGSTTRLLSLCFQRRRRRKTCRVRPNSFGRSVRGLNYSGGHGRAELPFP